MMLASASASAPCGGVVAGCLEKIYAHTGGSRVGGSTREDGPRASLGAVPRVARD